MPAQRAADTRTSPHPLCRLAQRPRFFARLLMTLELRNCWRRSIVVAASLLYLLRSAALSEEPLLRVERESLLDEPLSLCVLEEPHFCLLERPRSPFLPLPGPLALRSSRSSSGLDAGVDVLIHVSLGGGAGAGAPTGVPPALQLVRDVLEVEEGNQQSDPCRAMLVFHEHDAVRCPAQVEWTGGIRVHCDDLVHYL